MAPFAEVAYEVGPRTRLVAVSHVSWMTGALAPVSRAAAAAPLLLLDGAQGAGAVPVDVRALGCDFYAASGQKWLCGPNGSGFLFVRARWWSGSASPALVHHARRGSRPARAAARARARRAWTRRSPTVPRWRPALAALDVLEERGWPSVFERSHGLAEMLRAMLEDRWSVVGGGTRRRSSAGRHGRSLGRHVGAVDRLAAEGMIVRAVPGRPGCAPRPAPGTPRTTWSG